MKWCDPVLADIMVIMTYRGKVQDGVIVLENQAALPEGTQVRVEPVEVMPKSSAGGVGRRMMRFAGKATGLPRDAARNHDHYLYGTPKK